MRAEPVTIRASALTWWADCQRRSFARTLPRVIERAGYSLARSPRGIGSLIGTAAHKSAEIVLREKAKSGALAPASVATDAALEDIGEQFRQGQIAYDQTTPNRETALRTTLAITRAYHRQVAPRIEPVQIETRLEADFNDRITLSGQPDVVAIEPDQIDDLKTGVRSGNHNAQIGAYSLLARSAGIAIAQGAIDFIQRVGANRPQPDPTRTVVPLAIAEQTALNTLRHITQDLRVFEEGDDELGLKAGDPAAFLANPQSKLCSARYCPAHGTAFCREWQREQ